MGANERIRIGFIGPGRRGFAAHVKTLAKLRKEGAAIELAAVCDVYKSNEDRAVEYIAAEGPKNVDLALEIGDGWLPLFMSPYRTEMYRDVIKYCVVRSGSPTIPAI